MAPRPAVTALMLGLVAALPGCQAGMSGNVSKEKPTLPNASLSASEAIQRHNANAARVTALQAQPSITVSSPGMKGSAAGKMALERPRDFKLLMSTKFQGTVADIGSNGDEFWFWTKNNPDRNVYVCSYDDLERSPLSSAFQPEWIIEAMGLRSISREEAQKMTTKRGDTYGTIKLISTRKGHSGETLTKETILDPSGRIKEHRLFQGRGEKRTLLAYATIQEFRPIPVEGKEPISLPSKFQLGWMPEKLILDIQLDSVKLLPSFPEEQRAALFVEPEIPGMRRRNIAELIPSQGPPAATTRSTAEPSRPATARVRSSRPAPTSDSTGVRLGSPEPFGTDDEAKAVTDPVSLTADLSESATDPDPVVRPSLPRAVDQ